MSYAYYSRNGTVEPTENAKVSLMNVEYSYGFGVYETIRVNKGRVLFIDEHLQRLDRSAEIIDLQHQFSAKEIHKWLYDLIKMNDAQTCNIKILLIGAEKQEDAQLYIFCSQPLFPDRKLYRDGAQIVTYNYERAFPHAKTLNMLQSYLAYREAKRAGAYEALLIDKDKCVREGTRTNVFYIKGSTLYSPPEEEILLGVTRTHVIQVAKTLGLIVEHKKIKVNDMLEADASFITSTSTKIMPIATIDGKVLPNQSNNLKLLMDAFEKFLKTN